MNVFMRVVLSATCVSVAAQAQQNAGSLPPEASLPFTMTQVAEFNRPWRIAFLPDGRMLITEKVGPVWLVTQSGAKTPVANVPAVLYGGQGGMLGVYLSPNYATDHQIYLTYSEPGEPSGSSLALARARLAIGDTTASLEGLEVIWRDGARGRGGQFGAAVAFSPDKQYLFLTVGERQRMTPAQDPELPARQDSAPNARRKTSARQSASREDGRAHARHHQSAAEHGGGEDRAGRVHLHVSWTEPNAVGNVDDGSSDTIRSRLRAGRPAVGARAWAAGRRRAESDRARQELRLATRVVRNQLRRHSDTEPGHAGRSDQAGDLLDAGHRSREA